MHGPPPSLPHPDVELFQALLAVEALQQNLSRHLHRLITAEQDPGPLNQLGAVLAKIRFSLCIDAVLARRRVLQLLIRQVEIVNVITKHHKERVSLKQRPNASPPELSEFPTPHCVNQSTPGERYCSTVLFSSLQC